MVLGNFDNVFRRQQVMEAIEQHRQMEQFARMNGYPSFGAMAKALERQRREIRELEGIPLYRTMMEDLRRARFGHPGFHGPAEFAFPLLRFDHRTAGREPRAINELQLASSQRETPEPVRATRKATAAKEVAKADEEVILEMLKDQPALVEGPEDWAALGTLRNGGRTAEINRWLGRRAALVAAYWKAKLGLRSGRPRKSIETTAGYECALKVAACIERFDALFQKKKELRKRIRNSSTIKERLVKAGCNQGEAEAVISCSTPLRAACMLVAMTNNPIRSPETIANYYRRYQKSLDLFHSRNHEKH